VVKAESNFDPTAVSGAGAAGLMQLMPGTAASLGVEDVFNPEQNVEGGVRLLRQLLDRYQGNVVYALAAYNAGPGAVDRYGGVPPYRETQTYVPRVLGLMGTAANASAQMDWSA
jgi:soluble lytic murein transglycosylase-like protein